METETRKENLMTLRKNSPYVGMTRREMDANTRAHERPTLTTRRAKLAQEMETRRLTRNEERKTK